MYPSVGKVLCEPSKSAISVFLSSVELLYSEPASLESQMLWCFCLLMPDTETVLEDYLYVETSICCLLVFHNFSVRAAFSMDV